MNNNLKESALHYLSSPAFNKNTLVDITEIHVRSESDGDKMKAFVDAVKNPYNIFVRTSQALFPSHQRKEALCG